MSCFAGAAKKEELQNELSEHTEQKGLGISRAAKLFLFINFSLDIAAVKMENLGRSTPSALLFA
jgi:hypothetical protein